MEYWWKDETKGMEYWWKDGRGESESMHRHNPALTFPFSFSWTQMLSIGASRTMSVFLQQLLTRACATERRCCPAAVRTQAAWIQRPPEAGLPGPAPPWAVGESSTAGAASAWCFCWDSLLLSAASCWEIHLLREGYLSHSGSNCLIRFTQCELKQRQHPTSRPPLTHFSKWPQTLPLTKLIYLLFQVPPVKEANKHQILIPVAVNVG